MTQDMLSLGFDQIIIQLQEMAVSLSARRILGNTEPILNESLCRARMEETTAARRVMENTGAPPLTETDNTQTGLAAALQGSMLSPVDLCSVGRFCAAIRRLCRYLQGAALYSAAIASWHTELPELNLLEEDISRSVREDTVLDDASPALRNLRRLRESAEQGIRNKLNQIMGSARTVYSSTTELDSLPLTETFILIWSLSVSGALKTMCSSEDSLTLRAFASRPIP